MQIEIKGHAVQIDPEMLGIIRQYTWYISVRPTVKYAHTSVYLCGKRVSFTMHRLLTGMSAKEVDHINGDGLDNRLCNLRLCTSKQNRKNARKQSATGNPYKGISRVRRKGFWQAMIRVKGKQLYIGTFETAELAAKAYDAAAIKYHGKEFLKLNFPDTKALDGAE